MTVKQLYEIVNNITEEILGETALVTEDLSNIADAGAKLFNASDVDPITKALVNQTGKMVFVNRAYNVSVPSVMMDGWEFGSVMQKISSKMPEAVENEAWNLVDGESYDPHVYHGMTVEVKFYNKKVTFEIDQTITRRQLYQSFQNASQFNALVSMIFNEIDKSMTVKIDSLIMRTINSMAGDTIHSEYADGTYNTKSGVRAVNLLKLYNDMSGESLTAEKCITNMNFIKFASYTMANYIDRMKVMTSLFNVGGQARFTPKDLLTVVMLSDFKNAAGSYLQSDTFHNEYTKLPDAATVPYWQGSGLEYDFSDISSINIKTGSGNTVNCSGILAVMFDREALGVCNMDRRVDTSWNPKGEFTNYFYKYDAQYFYDLNENFVVFFVA